MNKNKSKTVFKPELNVLDQLITSNSYKANELLNDVHGDELKNNSKNTDSEPTPVTIANVFGGKKKRTIKHEGIRVLLDSGCSHSIIKAKYADKHTQTKTKHAYATGSGMLKIKYESKIHFVLPEFSDKKIIHWKFSLTESKDLGYDMIVGRDLMIELKINLSFDKRMVTWEDISIPMRDFHRLKKWKLSKYELKTIIREMKEPIAAQEATNRMIKILDSKYEKANLQKIVEGATHLNQREKDLLYKLLKKYEEIFDGTLGEWKTQPVELELIEGAKPHSQRHYPVPHLYKATFKKELDRLEAIGVLEKVQQSEWGSPTFIIPKKDNKVRFISDFRRLNQKIKRKPYPLPRIGDTLQQLEGFKYATSLDMNMGYYHIRLSDTAADMCTIITEFGKYRYKRLPMGVSCSPDIFQAKIYALLGDIEGTKAYIDDILVVKNGKFEEHLLQLEEVFRRCQKTNLKLNAEKCRFGLNEIDYLGYIVTPEGIKPNPKKIKAIQAMARPTTVTEVRRLIGMVQYYRDLWPRRSHILEPFTAISSGKKGAKIEWTPELEDAFIKVKQMICKQTLLTYPNWNEPFDVHTDSSDYQLGAVISQKGKPIAFFSRKLNSAQRNYTTTEKELLSIVECLKEFRNILFGYSIRVFSDHKNLVHAATLSQSQRVMRWRLILEEFGPDIQHISGEDNIVADAISRLPTTTNEDQNEQSTEAQGSSSEMLAEMEMFVLDDDEEAFPLNLSLVRKTQQLELNQKDSKLKKLVKDKKSGYNVMTIDTIEIIAFEDKIYVPLKLRKRTIEWYHYFLNHPGGDRLYKTLNRVCYFKGMASQCTSFCQKCNECQKYKTRKRKYGQLPPKNVGDLKPWNTVHVDLIGPYSLLAQQEQPDGSQKQKEFQLTCMTMIDPDTGWFEIVEVPNYIIQDIQKKTITERTAIDKSSARISRLFSQTWLSRYPRPKKVIFDNGSEFKKDFVPLLQDWSIQPQYTTIKNPQANSPVERIHQVLRQMLLTKNLQNQVFDFIDPFGEILASVAWAVRASYNSSTDATPAQLVFGRDMMFNLKTLINWKTLSLRKQIQVDKSNLRENRNRIDYNFQVGQRVYIRQDGIRRKLDEPKLGPFPITQVFTNGTVSIQRGHVTERINIRRLDPHFE